MIEYANYRKAFIIALVFHFFLAIILFMESNNTRPALTVETKNEAGEVTPRDNARKARQDIVKAVSVDSQQVTETVNRLKRERAAVIKAEQQRQQSLAKQVDMARKERLLEQRRLQKLKEESAKIAIARKKQMEEEQKHLKQLAVQKEQEAKRLEDLKNQQVLLEKQQREESRKLTELKKKQVEQEKLRLEKEQAQLVQQRKAAAERAAEDAAQRMRIAGEVDKYKAMILNAISQRWIVPENVNGSLSSQFRIRLAPDGSVLEVRLTRSSGDAVLDRSAQTAIYKASPLPVPGDAATFDLFRDISLTVRPENIRG